MRRSEGLDAVEEDRAPVRRLEPSRLPGVRVGVGASLVAK